MNRTATVKFMKYAIYALLLLLLYILQTVPGLFVLFDTKPVWVVPAAIAIAMFEGEFVGGIYGAVAGLLCDLGGFSLFGFNGFLICLCCILVGLLVENLMHCNVWSCLLFVFVTMLLCRSLEYLFAFGMWSYDAGWRVYALDELPIVIYSTLITPPPYLIARGLHRRFEAALR